MPQETQTTMEKYAQEQEEHLRKLNSSAIADPTRRRFLLITTSRVTTLKSQCAMQDCWARVCRSKHGHIQKIAEETVPRLCENHGSYVSFNFANATSDGVIPDT